MISWRLYHVILNIFLLSVSVTAIPRKVSVFVIKNPEAAVSEWQILDGQYRTVISEKDFMPEDSVFFSLEAGNRYILNISVSDISNPDTILCSLFLNGEPVLVVNSGLEPGDHFFPFFAGVKEDINKIIGGTDADISDFPWQVYYETGDYLCGGAIIADDWIVTAAHCTKDDAGNDVPRSEMFIRAGATNPYNLNEGEEYRISEVIVHEDFNNQTLDNDIALLRLEVPADVPNARPVKLVTPADADEGATDPGVISWVTGWGLTSLSPEELPYILQKVQLPIVSLEQASTVWANISGNVIMAGYRDASRDACNGDSGGPMVVPVSGEFRLAGITSWGSEDCDTYSGYTRVSAYADWIRTKTGIEQYSPPVPAGDFLICQGTNYSTYSVTPPSFVSDFQWELYPEEAGTIIGESFTGTVIWNPEWYGKAVVKLRVIINNEISEWSRLNVEVVKNTKLLTGPADRILCEGETIDLDITAEGHNLQYYWYRDGVLINTLTDGNFQIAGASTDDSGIYRCMITGSCGIINTDDINVTVHPQTRINSFSEDMTINPGDDVVLEVDASGHALTYRWFRNNDSLFNDNSPDLEMPDADASDIGLYQVEVKGTCGTELSGKAYLYVRKENISGDPEIFVWPTVTDGIINTALSTDEIYSIRIFNYTGKIIKDLRNCRYQTSIYMNNYPAGIYIISVYNRNFRWNQKFIKN